MPRYFIHMAYDGTNYHGWQIQPNAVTIQEVTERAMSTLLQEKISVVGAGRTDTGVHASYFISHFNTDAELLNEELVFKLNRFLPDDIVIYKIFKVPDDAHARFSALSRTYHYYINSIKPLFSRNYADYVFGNIDSKAINRCIMIMFEYSDFTSFSKLHTDTETNNCKIMKADWKSTPGGFTFEIQADRFLRNMVRSMVGTLLEVGHGRIDDTEFRRIIEAKDRGKAGMSAPAKGLFLVDIGYPEGIITV